MNNNPKVTVVLPCYNHEKFVRQSIESVLGQTYQDIELVILDNGSTDGSREIIRQYEQRAVVIYFDENDINEGRKAFRRAMRGEYLAIMTSDDLWEPEKIEKQINFLSGHSEYDACFTWTDYFNESMSILDESVSNIFKVENRSNGEWISHFWKNGNCLCCPSAFLRAEAYFEIWEQDVSYWQLYDFAAWIRFLLGGRRLYVIPEILVHMRMHTTAISFSKNAGNRLFDEMCSLRIEMFENISDELFREAFAKDFIYAKAESHVEILCEKILFLFQEAEFQMGIQPLVLDFFYRHYSEPEVEETLKRVYGKDRQYFNQKCSEFGVKAIMEHERKQVQKKQEEVRGQQSVFTEQLDSLIWAVTENGKEHLSCKEPLVRELYILLREIENTKHFCPGFSSIFEEKEWRNIRNLCRKGEDIDGGMILIYLHRLKTYFACMDVMGN